RLGNRSDAGTGAVDAASAGGVRENGPRPASRRRRTPRGTECRSPRGAFAAGRPGLPGRVAYRQQSASTQRTKQTTGRLMGFLSLFSKASPAVQVLPSGTVTVDRNNRILASTVSSACSSEMLQEIGDQILTLFSQ